MRQFRLTILTIFTSLLVLNAAFLRKAIAVLLCGVLNFNSTTCYGFLHQSEIATAETPSNYLNTTSQSNPLDIISRPKQKVAGLFDFKIPGISIPGLPNGGNPLEAAKTAIIKQIGKAVDVGSPLLLDQNTAFPDVS